MARTVLGMRGNGALRVRLLPLSQAGAASAATRVSGTGADKHATLAVDAARLEHACAALLCAVRGGQAVAESDALLKLADKADVDGSPLQRLCVWRAALAALEATGHVVRNGRWYTVRDEPRCNEALRAFSHLTRRGGAARAQAAAACCAPMDAVEVGAEPAPVSVAVGLLHGRLVKIAKPGGSTREARRQQRGLGRVQQRAQQRPRVKTERRAPKVRGRQLRTRGCSLHRRAHVPACVRRTTRPPRSRASACRSSPTRTRTEGGSASAPACVETRERLASASTQGR